MGASDPSKFEVWLCECAMLACHDERTPADYLWDLQRPGVWLTYFDIGLSPDEAVDRVFTLGQSH